jgi:hypothetical protein
VPADQVVLSCIRASHRMHACNPRGRARACMRTRIRAMYRRHTHACTARAPGGARVPSRARRGLAVRRGPPSVLLETY